jgi:hypothetical protein
VKGTLRLSGATSGYVGLAPQAAAGSTTYTLPAADGSNGQVLGTNGAGGLSWVPGAASGLNQSTSMQAGWPDAIMCNVTAPQVATVIFYFSYGPWGNGLYYYTSPDRNAVPGEMMLFNSDKTFNSSAYFTASDCNGKTIAQLYATGQAFDLVGGGGRLSDREGAISGHTTRTGRKHGTGTR